MTLPRWLDRMPAALSSCTPAFGFFRRPLAVRLGALWHWMHLLSRIGQSCFSKSIGRVSSWAGARPTKPSSIAITTNRRIRPR